MGKYDFSGWATRHNVKCSDGRVILKDAFKHNDGNTVPLIWNHDHKDPLNVLGHALLEYRDEGVYAYCSFNDTEAAQAAREQVKHGDIKALSIYANHLKQQGSNVVHGAIREVSLVLAGANPEAFIDAVIAHSDEHDEEIVDEAVIYTGESLELAHTDEEAEEVEEVTEETAEEVEENAENLEHAEEESTEEVEEADSDKTVKDILETYNEEQKVVLEYFMQEAYEKGKSEGKGSEETKETKEESQGGNETMKHNVFENEQNTNTNVLSHADQAEIIKLARTSGVGSFQDAVKLYAAEKGNDLAHGFVDGEGKEAIEQLFPDYKDVKPGAPEVIKNDLGWVGVVMSKTHKSPISRIRTRQTDARGKALRGKGYKKGTQKTEVGNVSLLSRTTDPQTIYVKDKLNRDDIVDITDFSVVEYQYGLLKDGLHEEIATAIMFGDGREDGDENKIYPDKVRPIWTDDELYTIHKDVDLAGMAATLQGSNTSANFGENYIHAEAFVTASLYAREQYKGSGSLEMFITPHELNVMMLARDLNGRRIYSSIHDLAAALDVKAIYTVEQMEGLTRTTKDGKTKKLLALMVNLGDYQCGATKGGQITSFKQFDIDFNQEKYLIETRMSGALVKIKSAIALEEEVSGE